MTTTPKTFFFAGQTISFCFCNGQEFVGFSDNVDYEERETFYRNLRRSNTRFEAFLGTWTGCEKETYDRARIYFDEVKEIEDEDYLLTQQGE